MKTPREYIKNLKNNIITVDMLNDVLYSFNKRAKNCRDQKNRYRNNYYTFTYFDNYSNYEEKEQLFYKKKQDILEKLVKPKCLHKQKIDKRKRIYDYIMEYLLRAEDDEKAELMGFVYEECVYGRIDNIMLLRLCSIIDRAFLYDLLELPKYMEENSDDSDAAYNFINLGLIDNYVGGVWKDMPSFQLNNLGHRLYDILNRNNWFDNHLSI